VTVLARVRRLTVADARLMVRAFLLVVRFRLALSLLPWLRLIAFTNRPRKPSSRRFSADRVEWAVRWAGRGVPGASCLTQALALNHLLACQGDACELHIGVNNRNGRFAAHAWVEVNGTPLLSTQAVVSGYARFLTWPSRPDLP
jgi:hypothetical protein